MANCSIVYNNDGTIQKVLNKSGEESQLYNQIMRLPIIKTKEEALEVYKQTYSQNFDDQVKIIDDSFKTPKNLLGGLVEKLEETGLATKTTITDNQGIITKLKEIGAVSEELKFQKTKVRGNNVVVFGSTTIYYKERKNPITGQVIPGIELDLIETAVEDRGKGSARLAMQEFTKYADATGQKIYVVVSPRDKNTEPSGIEKLNLENGFRYTSDFEMQRTPKKPKFQKDNSYSTPNGFVYQGEVFINSDKASVDTPIHEFSHLFNIWAKQNRPDIFEKGIELSKSEEAKPYQDFVKENQPELEEGTERFDEEVLAQMIGDNGAKIVEQAEESSIKEWLKSLWESIKNILGITNMSPNEISKLSLQDFLNAVNKTLFSGQSITEKPLKFRAGGNIYNSYREALKEKSTVEIGLITRDGFKALLETEYNIDPTTEEGFINSAIAANVMHDQKIEYLGKTYHIPRGQSEIINMVNMEILKDALRIDIGAGNYKEKNGQITIDVKDNIEKDTPKAKALSLYLNQIFNQTTENTKKISEKEVKRKLIELLNSMGVSIMSMDAYFKKYNTKNSTNPTAEALADIANRVVAFKDENLPIDQLTEEVMHFIVETLPKEQLDKLLEEITTTAEYQKYSEEYRKVYKGDENLVRREILGKVMKNIALSKIDNSHSQSLIGNIINAIKNFFENIFVSSNEKAELTKLDNLVNALIIEDQYSKGLTPSSLSGNEYVLYSINNQPSGDSNLDQLRSNIEGTIINLKEALYEVRGTKSILSRDSARLVDLQQQLGNLTEIKAVSDLAAMVRRITDEVDNAINKTSESGKPLSYEHRQLLGHLESGVLPALNAIKENFSALKFEDSIESDAKNTLLETISELSKEAYSLRGRVNNIKDKSFEKQVESMTVGMGQLEKEAFLKDLEDARNGMQQDINVFMSNFGELNHASSPYMAMLKHVIEKMYYNATINHQEEAREFANAIKDLGMTPKDLEKLVDGNYIIDIIDHNAFNDKLGDIDRKIYNNIKNKNLSKEEYENAIRKNELEEYSPEQTTDYYKKRKEETNLYVEGIMSDEYYNEQKERNKNISEPTLRALINISVQRAMIQKDASQADGSIVYNEQQKRDMQLLAKIRRQDKSFYDNSGTIKSGIKLHTEMVAGAIEEDGLYYTLNNNASQEAVIAFDLHTLDASFEKKTENQTDINSFREQLKKQKSLKDVINLIKNNLNIRLTNEFYGDNDTYFLNNEEFIKLNKEDENDNRIENYKKLVAKRNAILRLYKDSNSPVEVLAEDMSRQEKETVAKLTEQIDAQRNKFEYPDSEIKKDTEKETSVNRAYIRELEAQGIKKNSDEEIAFIKKHTSDAGRERLTKAKIAQINDEKGYGLTMSQEKILERIEDAGGLNAYARSQVLPYFKRTTPKGYKSVEEIWNEHKGNTGNQIKAVENYLEKIFEDPFYDVSLHQGANIKGQDTNPLHNSEYEGGYLQPKLSMFKNQKFVDMFDPVLDSKGNVVKVRKNEKQYKLREAYLNFQRKTLDAMKEKGSHNLYMLPQVSATNADKFAKLFASDDKLGTIKAGIRDAFSYNIDDKAYGEEGYRKTNTIPKFYLQPLEDKNDVSTDVFFTSILMSKQAHKYKARKESLSDAIAIEERLLQTNYKGGKEKTSTNQYKMFKSYRDNAFFNIMEERRAEFNLPIVGKIDVTKTLRLLNKYISIKNLGYNLIVPFTSMVTGLSQIQIEKWIGEYMNKDSHRLAFKEFRKLTGDARNKALDSDDPSILNILGEYFGIYDMSQKAMNAKYGKLYRTLSKSANIGHQAANFPVIPQILLTVLMDNRIVNGKVYNRNNYYSEMKASGVDETTYKSEWIAAEENTVYSFMNISREGVKIDKERLFKLLDKDIADKDSYTESMMVNIKKDIQQSSSFIDGQIPTSTRTAAQRDYLLSFMMTHRGFLSIGMQRRFKDKHFNASSKQVEEGTYRTLGKFLIDTFDFMKKNKTLDIYKAMKSSYSDVKLGEDSYAQELENELRKRNIIRVGKELAVMSSVALIATLLFAMAEDEDNEDLYGLQLTNYLFYRFANETASTQLGIFREGIGVIESPVVIYNNVKDLASVANIFDSEEIESGKYKGLSKSDRYFIKNIWGAKGIYDIGTAENAQTTAQNYRMYNENNVNIGSLFSSMGAKAFVDPEE